MTIRVVLAEDQAMVRGALVALLELEEDIRVVGQAATGEEAWELLRSRAVDVLVTDIEMPGQDGLALARRVKEAGLPCRVVVLTTFARPGYLRRALDAGAAAYLLKDAPAEELAAALRKVREGGVVVAPELAVEAWAEANPLSEREREVLRLAGEGMSGPAIADALSLSAGTVRNYLSDAIGKLGASGRIEAYRLARDKGWV